MKAQIKLEAIGDNIREASVIWRAKCNAVSPGLSDAVVGSEDLSTRPYVKEVFSNGQKKDVFGKKDYSKANRKGSRGVYLVFVIESGHYYEVYERHSWKSSSTYYVTASEDGDVIQVPKSEVEEWIKKALESTSTRHQSKE